MPTIRWTKPAHRRFQTAALIAALAVAVAGCARESEPPTSAPTGTSAAPATAPEAPAAGSPAAAAPRPAAKTEAVPTRREAPAELVLDAEAAAAVVAPLPAQVVRVHVRAGDTVAVGAPIATVMMPEAAIAAARAVAAADRLALVEQRIVAVEGLIAEGLARVGDRAELAARAAELRAERTIALATLRAAGLGAPEALAQSGGRHVLRAAVAGVITSVAVSVGENRDVGDGPMVRIVGGAGRRVVARWTNAQDTAATAVLLLGNGEHRKLKLVAVAPQRDAAGTLAAWYDVDGAPLAATMRGRVVIGGAP